MTKMEKAILPRAFVCLLVSSSLFHLCLSRLPPSTPSSIPRGEREREWDEREPSMPLWRGKKKEKKWAAAEMWRRKKMKRVKPTVRTHRTDRKKTRSEWKEGMRRRKKDRERKATSSIPKRAEGTAQSGERKAHEQIQWWIRAGLLYYDSIHSLLLIINGKNNAWRPQWPQGGSIEDMRVGRLHKRDHNSILKSTSVPGLIMKW